MELFKINSNIIESNNIFPSLENINNTIKNFIGRINQVPPIYSAVKVDGQRAYKLARNGKIFELDSKEVQIFNIRCLRQVSDDEFVFKLKCSSGPMLDH